MIMIRRILYFLGVVNLVMFTGAAAFSQLTVTVGKDTSVCGTQVHQEDVYIGTNVQVSGGTEPYTYTWLGDIVENGRAFQASHVLSDIHVVNPLLKEYPEANERFRLILEVEDAEGRKGRDSLWVRVSDFIYLPSYSVLYVYNDSVQFRGSVAVFGGIAPLTFLKWSPEEGLGDPYDLNTKAMPWENTHYYAEVKDSIGCTTKSLSYEVRVITTGLKGLATATENCFIAENVLHFYNPGKEDAVISIHTPAGERIQEYRTSQNFASLSGLSGSSDLMIISVASQKMTCSLKVVMK